MQPVTLSTGKHYGVETTTRRVAGFAMTRTRYAPGFSTPWHTHEAAAFCLVTRGHYIERFRRDDVVSRETMVLFRPPLLEHLDVIGAAGASCFIIEPALDWYRANGVEHLLATTRPHVARGAGAAEWYMRRAMREFADSDRASTLALEGVLLCVIAALQRAAVPLSSDVPLWLRRVRDALDSGFAEKHSLAGLAQDAGVHPVHLATTFRRAFGVTIGEYVRQRRIATACRLLIDSDRTIGAIGLDLGFATPSHFSRVFVRHTGVSPREYRALRS